MVKCRDHVDSFFINFTYAMKFLNNSRTINHRIIFVIKMRVGQNSKGQNTSRLHDSKAISAVCNVGLFLGFFLLQ